jgi:ABC-2 type transport system ATP-binding protein
VLIINKGRIVAEDTPQKLQSRLAGVQRVMLVVGGDNDGVSEVLSQVAGVIGVSQEGDSIFEFEAHPGQDARPEVARRLVSAGYDLLEMRPVGMSLEEIFLELTREEPTPPEVSEEGE